MTSPFCGIAENFFPYLAEFLVPLRHTLVHHLLTSPDANCPNVFTFALKRKQGVNSLAPDIWSASERTLVECRQGLPESLEYMASNSCAEKRSGRQVKVKKGNRGERISPDG